jgi:hypothetical protein
MGRATRYYREQCARYGWEPTPEQILYRANMLVAETDDEAHALLRAQPNQAPFTMREASATRCWARFAQHRRRGALAGRERRAADDVHRQPGYRRRAGAALPRGVGAGVLDLSLHPPGSATSIR